MQTRNLYPTLIAGGLVLSLFSPLVHGQSASPLKPGEKEAYAGDCDMKKYKAEGTLHAAIRGYLNSDGKQLVIEVREEDPITDNNAYSTPWTPKDKFERGRSPIGAKNNLPITMTANSPPAFGGSGDVFSNPGKNEYMFGNDDPKKTQIGSAETTFWTEAAACVAKAPRK